MTDPEPTEDREEWMAWAEDRIAELEEALEAAAPYTIHMASDTDAAKKAYAALGRPVGTQKKDYP